MNARAADNGAVPTIPTAGAREDRRTLHSRVSCGRLNPKPTRTRPAFADDGRTRPINQHPAKPAPLSASSWPDVCERRGDLPPQGLPCPSRLQPTAGAPTPRWEVDLFTEVTEVTVCTAPRLVVVVWRSPTLLRTAKGAASQSRPNSSTE